jgi:16S rRNA (guanine1516-N2)-methyltransferase
LSPKIWQKRRDAGKKQGLIKACKPTKGLRILDATAGWARDAVILASFGAHVTLLERHPIMVALIEDALQRLGASSPLASLLSLCAVDAKVYLKTLTSDLPDVIYIDPMHPQRQKSALVKKDMQTLKALIGTDEDTAELIHTALHRAKQRVVVKWPQHVPALVKPSISIPGKTVRFDIYFPRPDRTY